jgi:putative acetyltransferase
MGNSPVLIRPYQRADLDHVIKLYQDTSIYVNGKDYTRDQVERWASFGSDKNKWIKRISNFHVLVAERRKKILGFGEINDDGYIDYFYVHYKNIRKGIGEKIFVELEKIAIGKGAKSLSANVSTTAYRFFRKMGFKTVKINNFMVCDSPAKQYKMQKNSGV